MARRQPACSSFCAMAQAMLRLLARPKITAVFCGSVTFSSRGALGLADSRLAPLGRAKARPYNICGAATAWKPATTLRSFATPACGTQAQDDSVLYVHSCFIG